MSVSLLCLIIEDIMSVFVFGHTIGIFIMFLILDILIKQLT